MRLPLLALLLLAASSASAQETGAIAGRILESDGVTSVIGANVRVEGTTLGAATDIDGTYRIIGVPAGTYTVTVSYAGFTPQSIQGAEITAGATRTLSFTMGVGYTNEVWGCVYETPMITNDAIGQSRILTGWDLQAMPVNR